LNFSLALSAHVVVDKYNINTTGFRSFASSRDARVFERFVAITSIIRYTRLYYTLPARCSTISSCRWREPQLFTSRRPRVADSGRKSLAISLWSSDCDFGRVTVILYKFKLQSIIFVYHDFSSLTYAKIFSYRYSSNIRFFFFMYKQWTYTNYACIILIILWNIRVYYQRNTFVATAYQYQRIYPTHQITKITKLQSINNTPFF